MSKSWFISNHFLLIDDKRYKGYRIVFYTAFVFGFNGNADWAIKKKKQDGVFQVPNDEIITIFLRGIPRTLKI